MIPRYTRPEIATIWNAETRYRLWFEIEAHAADAMAELGIIPKEAAEKYGKMGGTRVSTSRVSMPSSARSNMM
jgi:adenylosuccinate lyase